MQSIAATKTQNKKFRCNHFNTNKKKWINNYTKSVSEIVQLKKLQLTESNINEILHLFPPKNPEQLKKSDYGIKLQIIKDHGYNSMKNFNFHNYILILIIYFN